MNHAVTIIITPRDRYSGLDECVDAVYRHTEQPFRLWIMDLDYPASIIDPVRKRLRGGRKVRFLPSGCALQGTRCERHKRWSTRPPWS